MGVPDRLILEFEKIDNGYNIINVNNVCNENYVVKDRHELSIILDMFLDLLDNSNITTD